MFLPKQGSKAPCIADVETTTEITRPHAPAPLKGENTEARSGQRLDRRPAHTPVEELDPESGSLLLSLCNSKSRALLSARGARVHLHAIWRQVVTSPSPSLLTAFSSTLPAEGRKEGFPAQTRSLPFAASPQNPSSDNSRAQSCGRHARVCAGSILCQTVSSTAQQLGLSGHDLGQVPYTLKG